MTEWDVKECPDCFGLDEDCKNCDGKGSIEEINTAYDQDQPIGDSPQALYSVGAEPIDAKTGKNFVTVKKLQEDEDRPEHFENVWEKLDSMVKKSSTEKLNKDGTGVKRATRGVNPNRTPHLNLIFVYVSKSDCDICKPYDGMMFPIDSPDRPIIPRLESQGKKGKRPYTHPHCRCKWVAPEISDDDWDLDDLDLIGLKGSARESYSQTKKDIIAIARKQNKNFDSLSKSQQNRIVMNVALRKLTKEVNFDEVKEMYDKVEPITMTEYGKRIDTEGLQKVIKKVVGESLTPKQCVEVEQQHNLDFTYENLLNVIGKKLIVNKSKAGELDWKQFGKDFIDIDKAHLDIHDLIEQQNESFLDTILPTPEQMIDNPNTSDKDRKILQDFLHQEELDKNNPDPIDDAFNWFKKKFGKETIPVDDMTDDELLNTREYVYGTYKNSEYLGKLDSEINRRGLGNPNYREERREEDLVNSQYGATEGGVGSGKKGHQKWMRGAYATEECPNCMIRTQKKDGSCELCGHEF